MSNSFNLISALNNSLEEEFKAKRKKLQESEKQELVEDNNMNESSFEDKTKAIKKSLMKQDKRTTSKSAQKSAEKIAGSMIKNESDLQEAQEYVVTYIADKTQNKTASISVQANSKVDAAQKARQSAVGDSAIVSIQVLNENYKARHKLQEEDEVINTYKTSNSDNNKAEIIKAPNGRYMVYYYDNDLEHWSSKAGPFNTEKEAEEMLRKHRPQAKLQEEDVVNIPTVDVELDYIINDVTVLDNVSNGDVQSPDIESLITLVDESLKADYSNDWGKINVLSSRIDENSSFALVDISSKEVLEQFKESGIQDIAIGKNLILEKVGNLLEFKVNNLNGTTKYCKKTTDPVKTIKEWLESEFLNQAKQEKDKEQEILKAKTEKETVENYIQNRLDLKAELENIKMFIELSKQVKAEEDMKESIQNRMYSFAAEMPNNIEVSSNDNKYELKFNNRDDIVEIVFGKDWVKENDILEVVKPINEAYKAIATVTRGDEIPWDVTILSDIINPKDKEVKDTIQRFIDKYDKTDIIIKDIKIIPDKEYKKMNEAYEQFNIGNIEVVFNPDTFECLYSIPTADVKDKKINLSEVPTVETPYDTNTIIKNYVETKFGKIPSANQEEPTQDREDLPQEQPANSQTEPSQEEPNQDGEVSVDKNTEVTTNPEETPIDDEPIHEDDLPEEPGEDKQEEPTKPQEVSDQETQEKQAETGSAVFMKVRPNQHSNIENIRTRALDGDTPQSNYIVVDEISLSNEEWDDLNSDFSVPKSFLTNIKPIDRKNYSFNVVKVTAPNAEYSLLIDPLGYDYSRYIAILDN